jgi:hypothetical protein
MPFPPRLPEHDLIIVAACESDANRALLRQLEPLLGASTRPVLNLPANIARTSREAAHALLAPLPGVCMPASARAGRDALESLCAGRRSLASVLEGASFPVIVRPVDSHAGHGLTKIDAAAELGAYLQTMPEPEFIVSQYVDYRDADGLFRKYRVVLVDGESYAGHMGVSDAWMIHYLNAGMTESAEKRVEEAAFMAGFEQGFARRHAGALRAVAARMELDYLVIDCGETRDGKLLLFELDTGAVVHDMDPVDLFPYKRPQMQKVFAAFRAMLGRRLAQAKRQAR